MYLGNFTGNDVFSGTVEKTNITPIIGGDSQLEAITNLGNEQYYLSREERNGQTQRVFTFSSLYFNLDLTDFTQTELIVYPNPIFKKIKINTEKEIKKIEIFNLNGRIISNHTNDLYIIDIANFSSGTYFLKIYVEQQIIIKKIIKI